METLSVGTVLGSGQPWSQQFDINLESNSVLGEWGEVGNLPITLSDSNAIVTRNRVFLLGGRSTSGNAISTIHTATINADGTLGVWSTAGNLPSVLYASSAIVTRNRVFLLGNRDGTTSITTIQTATINADGTLGVWSTAGNLPSISDASSVTVTRNRVFLLGGWQTGVGVISTIHTAPINADGTLGVWSIAGNLPSNLAYSSVIVTRNRVFLLGGGNGTATISTIFTATINADGTLGAWSTAGSLPSALHGSSVIVTRDRVFVLGGLIAWSTVISTIFTAPINADGTLGAWSTAGNLPSGLSQSQAIVTRNRVFLLGGWNDSTTISTIYSASFTGGLNDYSEFYNNDVE